MSTAARLLVQRLLGEAEPEPEQPPKPTPAAEPIDVKQYIVQQDITHAGVPEPGYYQNLLSQLGNRAKKKLDYNTYLIKNEDGSVSVRLHSTDIVRAYSDGRCVISTYGAPNPKQMHGFTRYGYYRQGFGETARSWRTPFTRKRLDPFLPCGWTIYSHGKSSIPSSTAMVGGKRGDQNWWWGNTQSRSGMWDGPGWRIPFSDFDTIDTKTGDLKSRLPPVPMKGRGSNPERTSGWGHEGEFHESKKPAPNWTNTGGIYADLSEWPTVEYYAKCPKCGHVHGNYKTMREAHQKRLCQLCDLETVNKIKEIVAHVDDPGVTGQSIARVVGEAEEPPIDVRSHIMDFGDWIYNTKSELEDDQKEQFEFVDEDEVMLEDPNSIRKYELKPANDYGRADRWIRWVVYRDSDDAEADALERVKNEISDEPENWKDEWLIRYVDTDRLKRDLYSRDDDYWEEMDPPEKVERLDSAGLLDANDFHTPHGHFRKMTPRMERKIDDAIEAWHQKQEEDFDPIQWLKDVYGREYIKYAFEHAPLVGDQLEKAAHDAIRENGWQSFIAREGQVVDLENGAVAIRKL